MKYAALTLWLLSGPSPSSPRHRRDRPVAAGPRHGGGPGTHGRPTRDGNGPRRRGGAGPDHRRGAGVSFPPEGGPPQACSGERKIAEGLLEQAEAEAILAAANREFRRLATVRWRGTLKPKTPPPLMTWSRRARYQFQECRPPRTRRRRRSTSSRPPGRMLPMRPSARSRPVSTPREASPPARGRSGRQPCPPRRGSPRPCPRRARCRPL